MKVGNKEKLNELVYPNSETKKYQVNVLKFNEDSRIVEEDVVIEDYELIELSATFSPQNENLAPIEIISPLSSIRFDKCGDDYIFILSNNFDPKFYSEEMERKGFSISTNSMLSVSELRDFYFLIDNEYHDINYSVVCEFISDTGLAFNSLFSITGIGTAGNEHFLVVRISCNMEDFIDEIKNK